MCIKDVKMMAAAAATEGDRSSPNMCIKGVTRLAAAAATEGDSLQSIPDEGIRPCLDRFPIILGGQASDPAKLLTGDMIGLQPVHRCAACPSVGSIGHPYSCQPPCKYNTKGARCKDYQNCVRCHICKWTKTKTESSAVPHGGAASTIEPRSQPEGDQPNSGARMVRRRRRKQFQKCSSGSAMTNNVSQPLPPGLVS